MDKSTFFSRIYEKGEFRMKRGQFIFNDPGDIFSVSAFSFHPSTVLTKSKQEAWIRLSLVQGPLLRKQHTIHMNVWNMN